MKFRKPLLLVSILIITVAALCGCGGTKPFETMGFNRNQVNTRVETEAPRETGGIL